MCILLPFSDFQFRGIQVDYISRMCFALEMGDFLKITIGLFKYLHVYTVHI